MQAIADRRRYQSVIDSWAVARIGVLLGGTDEQTLLPIKEEKPTRIKKRTAEIFLELVETDKLNHRVLGAFAPLMDEIIKASGRPKKD